MLTLCTAWYWCETGCEVYCECTSTRCLEAQRSATGFPHLDCIDGPATDGPWTPGTWYGRRPAAVRHGPRRRSIWTQGVLRWSELRSAGMAVAPSAAWWSPSSRRKVRRLPRCCSWCLPSWARARWTATHWRTCTPAADQTRPCRGCHWDPETESSSRADSSDRPRWMSFPRRSSCTSALRPQLCLDKMGWKLVLCHSSFIDGCQRYRL